MNKIENNDGSITYEGVLVDITDEYEEVTFDKKNIMSYGLNIDHNISNPIGHIRNIVNYDDTIKVDMHITEKFNVYDINNMTPSAYIKVLSKDGEKITKYEIMRISLCNNPNVDARIKTLKNQA